MKPVVLTFLTEDDLLQHIQTKGRAQRLALMRDRMARMLKESQQQVGPLAQGSLRSKLLNVANRLSCLLLLFTINGFNTPSMVSIHLSKWQQEKGEILPYRGTVHDIGASLTHKVLFSLENHFLMSPEH
jgi:hypothetical protein